MLGIALVPLTDDRRWRPGIRFGLGLARPAEIETEDARRPFGADERLDVESARRALA